MSLHELSMGRRLYPLHLGIRNQLATHPVKRRYKVRTADLRSIGGGSGGYGGPPAHKFMSAAHRRFVDMDPPFADGSPVSPESLHLLI
ncbi:hypothetical protein HAX54_050791 [Datura stramonium]|uniref:Uncharacterized protein n=1 Tax=Datura stramonium TaxID=4076 RepID=A0ABS8SXG7_DATST|nr:hypothetical protein [Datura stramonium]